MTQTTLQTDHPILPNVLIESAKASAVDTFTACGLEATALGFGERYLRCSGVVGMIWLNNNQFSWLMSLALPRHTALHIASVFSGFDIEFESPDMTDIVGEMANVLAGDIIARIAEHGLIAEMSLPTAVRGEDLLVFPPGSLASTQINLCIPAGEFWLRFAAVRR